MRSIFVLAMFGILLLHHSVSTAETFMECLTKCSAEMSSSNANCPPEGDEARAQCLKDSQEAMKICMDSCPKPESADMPMDTPKEK
jgi:hypothetical protein